MKFCLKLLSVFVIFVHLSCVSNPYPALVFADIPNEENKPKENNHFSIEGFSDGNIFNSLTAKAKAMNNADRKKAFYEFLNKNINLFDNVVIEKKSSPPPSVEGKEFTNKFEVEAYIQNGKTKTHISNTDFIAEYPVYEEGKPGKIFTIIKSDENGIVSFEPPAPKNSTDSVLKIYPAFLGSYSETAKTESEKENEDKIQVISGADKNLSEDIKKKIIAEFEYKVATAKKSITSTIAVLDFDQNDVPVYSENTTAVRLLRGLMQKRFLRVGLDEYRELAKSDDTITINAARKKFNGLVTRFIYGRTKIKKIEKNEKGKWVCEIEGSISVWDFKGNTKTADFTGIYSSEGNTKNAAIFNARAILGEKILADKLLYGL